MALFWPCFLFRNSFSRYSTRLAGGNAFEAHARSKCFSITSACKAFAVLGSFSKINETVETIAMNFFPAVKARVTTLSTELCCFSNLPVT